MLEKMKNFNSCIEGSISIPLSNLDQKPHLEFIKKESLMKEGFYFMSIGKTF